MKKNYLFGALVFFLCCSMLSGQLKAKDEKNININKIKILMKKYYPSSRFEVILADEVPEHNPFDFYKIVSIRVTGMSALDHPVLPSDESFGYFAYKNRYFVHLTRGTLDTLIGREDLFEKKDVSEFKLAKLIAAIYMDYNANYHDVLSSARDIKKYEDSNTHIEGYRVDETEFNKWALVIKTPSFVEKNGQRTLIFYVLGGWMHEKNYLIRVETYYDNVNKKLVLNRAVLTDKIFKQVPDVSY